MPVEGSCHPCLPICWWAKNKGLSWQGRHYWSLKIPFWLTFSWKIELKYFFFENDNSLPLCYIGNETLGLLTTESFNQWRLMPLFGIFNCSITINRKIMLRFTVKIWIYPAQPECFFISMMTRLGHGSDTSWEKNELSADFEATECNWSAAGDP